MGDNMNEILIYGISALLCCFAITTFILSRIPANVSPDSYFFKLDPFWAIVGTMFVGGLVVYHFFPEYNDMIKKYSYFDFSVPIILAVIIYLSAIYNFGFITNILLFGASLFISYMQPDDFMLFPNHLSPFTDKVVIALFIFIVAKGLGLLNGLSAISSLQFNAVLVAIILLSIFGFLPQVLAVVALSYLGSMLAFTFFSWPPEKLIMSNAAFSSLGFILGCFMLNGVVEYSDASMFIACSYLFTEVIIVLYNRYMKNQKEDSLYMNTSYFAISEDGKYEYGVVLGIIKILIIDCVIALIQVVSYERLAFPVFSIAVNIWLLSILAGNTVPANTLSVSKLGLKLVKSAVSKKKSSKKKK